MVHALKSLLIGLIVLALLSCGNKGPLYLPSDTQNKMSEAMGSAQLTEQLMNVT